MYGKTAYYAQAPALGKVVYYSAYLFTGMLHSTDASSIRKKRPP